MRKGLCPYIEPIMLQEQIFETSVPFEPFAESKNTNRGQKSKKDSQLVLTFMNELPAPLLLFFSTENIFKHIQ